MKKTAIIFYADIKLKVCPIRMVKVYDHFISSCQFYYESGI